MSNDNPSRELLEFLTSKKSDSEPNQVADQLKDPNSRVRAAYDDLKDLISRNAPKSFFDMLKKTVVVALAPVLALGDSTGKAAAFVTVALSDGTGKAMAATCVAVVAFAATATVYEEVALGSEDEPDAAVESEPDEPSTAEFLTKTSNRHSQQFDFNPTYTAGWQISESAGSANLYSSGNLASGSTGITSIAYQQTPSPLIISDQPQWYLRGVAHADLYSDDQIHGIASFPAFLELSASIGAVGAPNAESVPEPSGIILLAVGGLFLAVCRRRRYR